MTRTAHVITFLIIFAAALTLSLANSSRASACPAGLDCSHPNDGQCLEDEPCFDWTQDGNGARGVKVLQRNGGSHWTVVGTCRYQTLWYHGRIPYRVTVDGQRVHFNDRLKGDHYARRYGCGFDVQDY